MSHRFKYLLFFCFLFWIPLGSGAQSILFDRLGAEQGFPLGIVNGILQDETGFIWIATPDGLYRYDGYGLKAYKHRPTDVNSLSDNNILTIQHSNSGKIWIGTAGGGLNLFDPATETFRRFPTDFNDPKALSNITVRGVVEDSRNLVWITTAFGLNRLNPATGEVTRFFNQPGVPNSLPSNDMRDIAIDREDRLWIATDDATGLVSFNPQSGRFTLYRHNPGNPNSVSNNSIRAVFADEQGFVWVGTDAGLNRLNPANGHFWRVTSDPRYPLAWSRVRIETIIRDSRGNIWFGTVTDGIFRLDINSGKIVQSKYDVLNPNSISGDWVLCLFESRSKIIWAGTSGNGINKYSPVKEKFRHYKKETGKTNTLQSNTIRALYQDMTGDLWIGTISGGVTRMDLETGEMKTIRRVPGQKNTLPIDDVSAVFQDTPGEIWFGTWRGGLVRMNQVTGTMQLFQANEGNQASLSDDRIQTIFKSKKGNFWIGTENGLNLINREAGTFTRFRNNPSDQGSISDSRVQTIYEDSRGRLWIGTWNGLNLLNEQTGQFTRYLMDRDDDLGINNNSIISITEDRSGKLWLATYGGGLNLFDPQSGKVDYFFSEEDGLPSNLLYGLARDDNGQLWISTTRGLSRFNPVEKKFRNYDSQDGLQSTEFYWGAYHRLKDGHMVFGGLNGFNYFHPDSVYDNSHVPPLVLTGFKIFDKPASLPGTLHSLSEIVLSYEQNFFTFEFAALDFNNPEKNNYAYKLEGFNDEWITAGNNRSATFTNLDGGDYTFRVIGSNSDNQWNMEGLAIKLTVLPPFYKTWWFRILVGLLVAGLVWFWFRTRLNLIEKQKDLLEQQVAERTHELALKTESLENINTIVKAINSELNFGRLLQVVLEQIRVIKGIEFSVAIDLDRTLQQYVIRLTEGTSTLADTNIGPRADFEEHIISGGKVIAPNILVIHRPTSNIHPMWEVLDRLPASMLVFRILVDQVVEGYLIFGNWTDATAFDNPDVQLFENLREHIQTAFIKTRLMDELRILNEKKNEFLGIAAHDLRNPLTIIMNYVQLVAEQLKSNRIDPAKASRDLEKVLTVTQQMTRMIAAFLDISSIEAGKIELNRRPDNVSTLLMETESFYQRLAEQKSISLQYHYLGRIPEVYMDRDRVAEVVDNLVTNAIKYTHPGGSITVTCYEEKGEVLVTVSDTGQGLTESDMKELFTSFKKLSSTPTAGEASTGLGLAIVKKIMDLHQGRVWAQSRKGHGSSFSIAFPVLKK